MRIYLCNAFSLNMLDVLYHDISICAIKAQDVIDYYKSPNHELVSAIGHPDTAKVFSDVLGIEVLVNRASLKLGNGDCIVVGQYRGARLEAGATELPEGSRIEWALLVVQPGKCEDDNAV